MLVTEQLIRKNGTSSDRLSDAELVERLKAGDGAAFEVLVERYQAKVYRLAKALTRNPEDAKEVVQDVFLSVYRKIKGFDRRAAFSTWLYRIATNAALMKLRRRKPEAKSLEELLPKFTENGHHGRPVTDWTQSPEELLLRQEIREIVREAIERLPADYRAVLVLRDIEGLSNQEAAEVLRLSVLAVKGRLHRARLVLREKLARYILHILQKPEGKASGVRSSKGCHSSIRALFTAWPYR